MYSTLGFKMVGMKGPITTKASSHRYPYVSYSRLREEDCAILEPVLMGMVSPGA
jgi:hypothetical protein